MASPNLAITHIAENQNQNHVTANQAFDALDRAATDSLTVSVASANATVTAAQLRRAFRVLVTGADTAGRTVTLPQIRRPFAVRNSPAASNVIEVVRGTSSFEAAPGESLTLYLDGTENGLHLLASSDPAVSVNPQGDWEAGTYQQRDLVRHDGAAWVALTETTDEPSLASDDWMQLVVDGVDGIGLVWRGDWTAQAYDEGDLVRHDDKLWAANDDTADTDEPGDSGLWDLFLQDGTEGADGEGFEFRGDWDDSTPYVVRDVVLHENALWIAIDDSTDEEPGIPSDFWDLFLPPGEGEPGEPGQGLSFEGDWNDSTEYDPFDFVTHEGSSWLAVAPNDDEEPFVGSSFWVPLALKGEDGADSTVPGPVGLGLAGVETIGGTSHTFEDGNEDKLFECTSGSSVTLTIPLDSAHDFDIGTTFTIVQAGAGTVTIEHAGTLNVPDGLEPETAQRGAAISAIKIAADTWRLIGWLAETP